MFVWAPLSSIKTKRDGSTPAVFSRHLLTPLLYVGAILLSGPERLFFAIASRWRVLQTAAKVQVTPVRSRNSPASRLLPLNQLLQPLTQTPGKDRLAPTLGHQRTILARLPPPL